ncbi:MAG: 50S ribosomal protein L16 [DPANN group archaeon]|nr:50S ribosomal protein L16 [DPANN group archaeon]
MAKLRKACAYRSIERPYTRRSKFREKSYIKAMPNSKVVRYDMGNLSKRFAHTIDLVSKDSLQIRHNAIESARLAANRVLEGAVSKVGFNLRIRIYPHHILRENPLASGAGADRMSTGMKMSFGKPIGSAARVKEGQVLFTASVDKSNINLAKQALKKAAYKLPCACQVIERAAA